MYCSNLSRAPAIPLFSRVSLRPKGNGFDPSSLSIQFHPKALRNDAVSSPKTLDSIVIRLKLKNFLMAARGFCTVSARRSVEYGAREKGRKSIPWTAAAYRDRGGRRGEKRAAVRTNRSSWVESEKSYFSRDGRNSSNESVESRDNGRNRESRGERRDLYEEKAKDEEKSYFSRNGRNLSNERVYSIDNGRSREGRGERRNLYEEKAMGEEEEEDGEPVDDPRWDGIRSKYTRFANREPRFDERRNRQENWGRKVWKEDKESSLPKMVGQGVYGVGPVLAALNVERREFYAWYVQEGLDLNGNKKKKKDKKGVEKVLKLAEKLGLKVVESSKHDLNMVVDNRPHQGLVLDASPLEMVNIKELQPAKVEGQRAPVWVALDEVTDPQNLGAIVRSSYFFGVEGVVLCAKNSAPLSGVVSKASAGSLELIELRSCKNMMQFLSSSIENGWRVIGGSVSSKAHPLNEVEDSVPTILVLGSEGRGLRPLVERTCTELVRIPGNVCIDGSAGENEFEAEEMDQSGKGQELKSFLAVESLNVSVATGVLLYHLVGNTTHLSTKEENTPL